MIKHGIVVAGGLVVLIALFVALVLGRTDQETATPQVQAPESVPELVSSGEGDPVPVVAQPDGKRVDELGLEWDQLSFDNPLVQPHPDGGVKLIPIHRPDGTVDMQPGIFRSTVRQKRMPIMRRTPLGQEHDSVGQGPQPEPQVEQEVDQ